MKKLFVILIVVILNSAAAFAEGKVYGLFNGPYKNKQGASQVVVKGDQLKEYNLNSFMSLTVASPDDCNAIERAVEADAKIAKSKEVTYSQGKMVYAFLILPSNGSNRYVFFYRDEKKSVVMYLNGKASPSQVENLIKSSKKQ